MQFQMSTFFFSNNKNNKKCKTSPFCFMESQGIPEFETIQWAYTLPGGASDSSFRSNVRFYTI